MTKHTPCTIRIAMLFRNPWRRPDVHHSVFTRWMVTGAPVRWTKIKTGNALLMGNEVLGTW